MEIVLRQVCFSVFVLLAGLLLAGTVLPEDGMWGRSLRFYVPLLLYAAAELCSNGRGAAGLLPVRMLMLLYGTALHLGLDALFSLLRPRRGGGILRALVLPITVAESALLGYVLLRDGRCGGTLAVSLGAVGFAAAATALLLCAARQRGRSAR